MTESTPSHPPLPIVKEISTRCQLDAKHLKRYSDPEHLPKDTRLAPPPDIGLGQARAIKALRTALEVKASGYHVFAAGQNGLGKRTMIQRLLQQIADSATTPDDLVYVHNFADPRTPIAICLPAGEAPRLQAHLTTLWQQAKKRLSQRFRSDRYQSQVETIKNDAHEQESRAYDALNAEGKQYDLALTFRASDNKAVFVHPSQLTDTSASSSPPNAASIEASQCLTDQVTQGHSVDTNITSADGSSEDTDAAAQSVAARDEISSPELTRDNFVYKNRMHKRLNQLTIALEQLEDDANEAIEALHRDIATRTLGLVFDPIVEAYADQPKVRDYLEAVRRDMITHVERIVNADDDAFIAGAMATVPSRYAVNIMVTHTPNSGAPVVFEDLPTHLNLLGHVEQITQLGTVTTDVSMIRAGALHRANGGYLLLEASHLLEHPYAWQGLKRALQSRCIKLSSLEQMLTLTGSLSLAPQSVALDIKVILLGPADLYYELLELEPEFDAVFKVRADFHEDISRCPEHELAMVAKMADIIQEAALSPFDSSAQAALLEHLSLQAEDQDRLSLHSDGLIKLLHESHRHARLRSHPIVSAADVHNAISDMDERSGYLRDLYWHELKNGQQLIQTHGWSVGQVNALTLVSYADSEFGMPARLTAVIQPNVGSGDILDIERDVDLGGSLHAKGMLIMTSYLRALFSEHHALNFSASLAFEQSYAHIDGDSATVGEACALLSALAAVPINQALAITGSMNQLGDVQAVGGINAKIAGFFDACQEQQLTGEQGVIIPRANVSQLMLRDDIIAAIKAKRFAIYAVSTLSEALTLMTGLPVDTLNKKQRYRKRTLFGKVLQRLQAWEDAQDTSNGYTKDNVTDNMKETVKDSVKDNKDSVKDNTKDKTCDPFSPQKIDDKHKKHTSNRNDDR